MFRKLSFNELEKLHGEKRLQSYRFLCQGSQNTVDIRNAYIQHFDYVLKLWERVFFIEIAIRNKVASLLEVNPKTIKWYEIYQKLKVYNKEDTENLRKQKNQSNKKELEKTFDLQKIRGKDKDFFIKQFCATILTAKTIENDNFKDILISRLTFSFWIQMLSYIQQTQKVILPSINLAEIRCVNEYRNRIAHHENILKDYDVSRIFISKERIKKGERRILKITQFQDILSRIEKDIKEWIK